jgi:hypothetical protein
MIDRSANSTLGRNLAIIVVLLIAIFFTWQLLEKKKAAHAEQVRKATEKKEAIAKQKEDERLANMKPAPVKPSNKGQSKPPSITPKALAETPAQSLIRLREALAEGDFTELPTGTLTKGSSYYFFVSKATTWPEASRMARDYGGHLPLAEDSTLQAWIAESIPADSSSSSTWIGATHISADMWQWVNGKPWTADTQPQGSGSFASIERSGTATANTSSSTHPFFIQWHRDGSNPTKIKEILRESAKSRDSEHPFFPPGTETLGARRFLVVDESLSYPDAHEWAKLGGGELMTAATEEEANWLEKRLEKHNAPKGLWLGATLKDDYWTWNSNQTWQFARWASSSLSTTGDALLILPGKGWSSADQNDEISGFIIEWSDDSQAATSTAAADPLEELSNKAKGILKLHDTKRDKDVAKVAADYIFKLEVWLGDQGNNSQIAAWTPRVQAVIATVKDGRLPADIPKIPNEFYPKPLLDIAQFHLNKQQGLDADFTLKAEALRDAYVARSKEEIEKEQALGQQARARKIAENVTTAADIDAWLASLGFAKP